MKIEIADVSGLSDALKTLVEEADGTSTLDLAQVMPFEDVNGLKTALVKERENVSAYKKFGTVEEIQTRISDLEAKAKNPKANEDHERIVAEMKTAHEADISQWQGKYRGLLNTQAQATLKAELAKAGVVTEGLDMMAGFAASRIQFNDDGTPKVLSKDGSGPMIGSGANGGATLEDLAKELAGSIPHLVKDGGTGGGGKPPQNGGTPARKRSSMSPEDKGKFIKEHGQEAYLNLPK